MSWAYAEACANMLANQGVIPADRRVWLLPRHSMAAKFCFTETLPKSSRGPRQASVSPLPLHGARCYIPHGEGAL